MLSGNMMVFWPYAWGLTFAARATGLGFNDFASFMLIGFVGACLSHRNLPGTGCVWNDIVDRKFDQQVERTKRRPVASGSVSVGGAVIFLLVHIVSLLSMIWTANPLPWNIGIVTIFPLAGIYPFCKRFIPYPQAWLGVAINTGSTMAWALVTGEIPKSAIILAAGAWMWTMWYDTIYASQDKQDDVKAGVKSSAVSFAAKIKAYLFFFGSSLMAALVSCGILNNQSILFYVISVVGGALHLAWQLYTIDVDSPKSCWKAFRANAFVFGGIVEAGLFLDYLTKGNILAY
ncbi:4-hydroxybenzoate polyprenyl transferase [Gautieria morchelliformis]|nr:4-hydroxybenzoate polyprenyl transferase [Gautieria morchelliformis]